MLASRPAFGRCGEGPAREGAAVRRIIDFYRLQIQVMREWQPSGSSRLRRIVVTLLISVVSLGGAVFLTPGFDMVPGSPVLGTLLLGAIILGLLNLLVRPVFLALFAGISVIAVAIATISFQIATFLLLGRLVDQLQVSGILVALVASLIYATFNTILVTIFSVTSDDSYFAVLMQQIAARRSDVVRSDKPGLVIIQIDGLAEPILARQVRAGRVPHLSDWLRSGRYVLDGWEALLPPTTPASQAGILHGNNDGIPAFRWYEKDDGRLHGGQPPGGRDGRRRPDLERRGPALERRREHRQPLRGRRVPVVHLDGDHQGQGAGPRPERDLHVLLREPLQLPHDDRAVRRRRSSRSTSRRGARSGAGSSRGCTAGCPTRSRARPRTSRCATSRRRS